jgi:predicted phosphodiesterase
MRWLITSDTHFSDRPRDAYRFGLFKWLAKMQEKHRTDATFILGDLTDIKDRHPSSLVNRVVRRLNQLQPPVYILKGNHDYTDPSNPFFAFLNHIKGLTFVTHPSYVAPSTVLLVPHQKNQTDFDAACEQVRPKSYVFCHQTFEGAIAETGSRLSGFSLSRLEAKRPAGCWSGDVHKPQRIGPVTFVGAPYTIRFGDDFTPRVLLVTNEVEKNLYFPTVHKWALHIRDVDEILQNEDLRAGDHVKVVLELTREEVVGWPKHKQMVLNVCKEMGLEVYGVALKVAGTAPEGRAGVTTAQTPEEVFNTFCIAEKLASNIKRVGLTILKG